MDFPFVKEAIAQLFSKPSTAMYPVVPSEAAPNYRGRIVFHPEKCINCMMCERVCSGNAITTTVEKTEEGDLVTRVFNLGSCTFCATCMDFCHGAIEFTRDYHMVATKEEDLLVVGTFLRKKPVKKAPPAKPAAPAAAEAPKPAEAPKAEEAKPAAPAEEKAPAAVPPAAAPVEEKAAEPAPAEVKEAPAEAAPAAPEPRDDGKPVQDPSKCVYCTLCAKNCPGGALEVDRKAKTWKLDEDLCVACGTCASVCPKDAIIM